MKNILIKLNGALLFIALFFTTMFVSCSDDDDNRSFETVRIVGVKIDSKLFTPSVITETETVVEVPAGKDLSNSKLQVLVANGELQNFVNEVEYDVGSPSRLKSRVMMVRLFKQIYVLSQLRSCCRWW